MASSMLNLDIKEHHKDQLLTVLFYYMDQDVRQKLMLECPAAYNAACGSEVVAVSRTSDNTPIVPGVHRTTVLRFGNGD